MIALLLTVAMVLACLAIVERADRDEVVDDVRQASRERRALGRAAGWRP